MIYACDFETTTDKNNANVWLWCVCELNSDNLIYGKNIESFIEWTKRLNKNSKLYFHNLKFDGSYILNYCLKNGYTHVERLKKPNELTTLISEKNIYFSIEISHNYINRNGKEKLIKIKFLDSLKIIPLKISEMPKTFGLPYEKLEIDYKLERHNNWEITEKEKEYIKTDVLILRDSLNFMFKIGINRMTIASSTFNLWKETIGKKRYERIFPTIKNDIAYETKFDLTDEERYILSFDKWTRKSYKGGYTYLNPIYQNKEIGNVYVYDVNSLYPFVMLTCKLPYGVPIITHELKVIKGYPLYIIQFECVFELKNGYLPTLQIKNSMYYNEREYLSTSDGEIVNLTLTSVDFEIFKEHYNIYEFNVIKVHFYRCSDIIFKEYLSYWKDVKEESGRMGNNGMRFIAKQLQNSLYGKFATNPIKFKHIPFIGEDGLLKFKLSEGDFSTGYYLPVGVFITSYARSYIINYAQKCFDSFIYCDTDSLHLTKPNDDIPLSENVYGEFKLEKTFDRARYIRAKRYIGEKDGKLKITCAGLPKECYSQVTFDNFKKDMKYKGKLQLKQGSGGAVLIETEFTLK